MHRRKTELHGGISVNYNSLPSHMLYFQHKAQEKVLLSLELLLLESQKLKWLQDGYILESQFGYCHCPRAARESNAHVAPWGHCPLIQE